MTLLNLCALQLTFGLAEVIIFQFVALILGFTIHFFWKSKFTSLPPITGENHINEGQLWRLKYYGEVEAKQLLEGKLQSELRAVHQQKEDLLEQIDDLQYKIEKLSSVESAPMHTSPDNYMSQLSQTHDKLTDHNKIISSLLTQIERLKDTEEKLTESRHLNNQYQLELRQLRAALAEKDGNSVNLKAQQILSDELSERLEATRHEFSLIQDQFLKLQSQLNVSNHSGFNLDKFQTGVSVRSYQNAE